MQIASAGDDLQENQILLSGKNKKKKTTTTFQNVTS